MGLSKRCKILRTSCGQFLMSKILFDPFLNLLTLWITVCGMLHDVKWNDISRMREEVKEM